jgi:chemotaxis protein methyltransferase CheR
LPELIAEKQKQAVYGGRPSLRIWSAGCSTGEEAYSLAILISELIPDWRQWDLRILGTDINSTVIVKAKEGIYSQWSFRMVPSDVQATYFKPYKTDWQILPDWRSMVHFDTHNLVEDSFPSYTSGIHNMDLIICRNVFIYFQATAIAATIEKFYHTLNDGGYLLNGHTDLYGQDLSRFKTKIFPESVVCQRDHAVSLSLPALRVMPVAVPTNRTEHKYPPVLRSAAQNSVSPLPTQACAKTANTTTHSYPDFAKIDQLLWQEAYAEVIQAAEAFVQKQPRHFNAHCCLARAYANLGQHDKADHHCQQAIAIDPLSPHPYYVMAHMAEERNDREAAKRWLKQIIYLEPNAIAAYIELGDIYSHEQDRVRSRKMRLTALSLLESLPLERSVEQYEPMTVGELIVHVHDLLRTQ